MKLLYVDACPRPRSVSRTLALADAFFGALRHAWPEVEVETHALGAMGLRAVDGEMLSRREALIDARAWDDPLFAPARAFVAADAVVIAAPYWDLMFPAMLKVYIEHVFIREMTFRYVDDQPIGLCAAKRALYLTTAGSPIGAHDFGTDYLRATLAMLGIGRFDAVKAEGLDLRGAPSDALVAAACAQARRIATDFLS